MSTLVERLRSKNCCNATNCNCDESADALERLEKLAAFETQRSIERNTSYEASIAELEKETERLTLENKAMASVIKFNSWGSVDAYLDQDAEAKRLLREWVRYGIPIELDKETRAFLAGSPAADREP